MKTIYWKSIGFGLAVLLASCETKKNNGSLTEQLNTATTIQLKKAPVFEADSAYAFVQKQVSFGTRVPNTPPHVACGNYLAATLKQYGWQVTEQPFEAKAFDGTVLKSKNIFAAWNPSATKRILLAAHWDTRPFADQEKDATKHKTPIDGANDGASGVAVLLEIARTVAASKEIPLEVGIDILLLDSEDYGQPEGTNSADYKQDTWCLGSQYWANNKHQANYGAYYGILLDMVGGMNAKFHQEQQSMKYAPSVVQQVWQIGQQLGYGQYFITQSSEPIIDDHIYINNIARIPMIDIIHYDPSDGNYFQNDWHTLNDNIKIIDKQTLKAVGQTVLQTVYNETK